MLLEFTSPDPCWFDLRPDTTACGDDSPRFTVLPVRRPRDDTTVALGRTLSLRADPTPSPTLTASPSTRPSTASPTSTTTGGEEGGPEKRGGLSAGAKAGIGVAIAGAIVAAIGMFSCFYLRRRSRSKDAAPGARGRGRGRDKLRAKLLGRPGPSDGVQPVFDGFPGSTGYDDFHSLQSSAQRDSPTWSHSSTRSNTMPYYQSHKEELAAARMNTPAAASNITSYSPNPSTRVSTSRLSPRPSEPGGSISIDSREGSVPSPDMPLDARPKPPAQRPFITSYGPNPVTPTPVLGRSTTTPDDAFLTQVPDLPVLPMQHAAERQHQPAPPPQERKFSWEAHNNNNYPAEAGATPPPLPPYYAAAAGFYAAVAEKKERGERQGQQQGGGGGGAIRTLEEPPARAELPPTKDGYYHFGDAADEYELPGNGGGGGGGGGVSSSLLPLGQHGHAPQMPHRLYRDRDGGGGGGPGGRGRELDEQKFLLSDVEIAKMRAQKAGRPPGGVGPAGGAAAAAAGESYEMSGGPSSGDVERR